MSQPEAFLLEKWTTSEAKHLITAITLRKGDECALSQSDFANRAYSGGSAMPNFPHKADTSRKSFSLST